MDLDRRKNLTLVLVAAVCVGALNLLVWMVAREGVIPPISNVVLWLAFAVLSVAVIPWAISQLGLQPLVISLSYVAGGFVAFRGLEGSTGIHLAEVTTAGAAYGAFGAAAIGNATHRIRMAFFDRRQTALMFIIFCLLFVMALLNSEIIGAVNSSGYLKAIILPFTVSGMAVSLVWALCIRMEAVRSSRRVQQSARLRKPLEEQASAENGEPINDGVMFEMPVESDEDEETDEDTFVPRLSLPEVVRFEQEDQPGDNQLVRSSVEHDLIL